MKQVLTFLLIVYAVVCGIFSSIALGESIQQVAKPFMSKQMPEFGSSLKDIPVQFNGRIKPLDTFARNVLQFIYGKDIFYKASAVDVLLSWMLVPDYWNQIPFVQIKKATLKHVLKLNIKKQLFSPTELLNNPILKQELEELHSRIANKEPLDTYFKSIQKLENQLSLYMSFQKGTVPGFFPTMSPAVSSVWISLEAISKQNKDKASEQYFKNFQKILAAYMKTISAWTKDSMHSKWQADQANLKDSVYFFKENIAKDYPSYKKLLSKIKIEVAYNTLNPFRLAWLLYLFGLLLWGLTYCLKSLKLRLGCSRVLRKLFVINLCGGFVLHTSGIVLRSLIMSRPPVTNMYETVIWVPWAAMLLAGIIWIFQRFSTIWLASILSSFFCLLLVDMAPYSRLSDRLEPLEAVLNSNFWLSTHVLIITMSYGAFLLAFLLGDISLYLFCQKKSKTQIHKYIKAIDRSLQIGVVLLALGTILGGIWADYSWGRFWGWDPKETWALISLLGYLALLHGRLTGWIKEFGMAVGAVLMFFLILMAWYGVNYILGQGLHSYGFGSGGAEYVLAFIVLHLIYVFSVWTWRKKLSN